MFELVCTQFRPGPGGVSVLDYPAVFAVCDRFHLRLSRADFRRLRVMEDEGAVWFAEQSRRGSGAA